MVTTVVSVVLQHFTSDVTTCLATLFPTSHTSLDAWIVGEGIRTIILRSLILLPVARSAPSNTLPLPPVLSLEDMNAYVLADMYIQTVLRT